MWIPISHHSHYLPNHHSFLSLKFFFLLLFMSFFCFCFCSCFFCCRGPTIMTCCSWCCCYIWGKFFENLVPNKYSIHSIIIIIIVIVWAIIFYSFCLLNSRRRHRRRSTFIIISLAAATHDNDEVYQQYWYLYDWHSLLIPRDDDVPCTSCFLLFSLFLSCW